MANESTIVYEALNEEKKAAWREAYLTALGALLSARPANEAYDIRIISGWAESCAAEMIRRMRSER